MSSRARLALAACALAASASCAGRVEPVIDLTPWTWTWSQTVLGSWVIRYAHPDDPEEKQSAGAASGLAGDPVVAGMLGSAAPDAAPPASSHPPRATRLAAFRYDCAREDRAESAPCSVYLDFWLLALEPPLAAATLAAHEERLDRLLPDPPSQANAWVRDRARDARGREWSKRALTLASGATFSHYSQPLDAQRALAVTAYTSRAPDRVAAYELARDAIDRIRIEPVR